MVDQVSQDRFGEACAVVENCRVHHPQRRCSHRRAGYEWLFLSALQGTLLLWRLR